MAASPSSTPPTPTRAAPARSRPAGCWPSCSAATRSWWPPRCSCRWGRARTAAACPASTSCPAIDASLRRLDMDYVDLYQIHRWDYRTPIEETMEALHDVVRAGKARYIGASSMFAWQFAKAQHVAERHGWTRFVSMQNHYNLIYREEEREMIPQCIDQGVGGHPVEPAGPRRARRQPDPRRRAADDPVRHRPVRRHAVQPARRLRRRGPGGGGGRRARRAARAGRAGLAAAAAGRDGARSWARPGSAISRTRWPPRSSS